MSTIKNSDTFLVNRGEDSYHVLFNDIVDGVRFENGGIAKFSANYVASGGVNDGSKFSSDKEQGDIYADITTLNFHSSVDLTEVEGGMVLALYNELRDSRQIYNVESVNGSDIVVSHDEEQSDAVNNTLNYNDPCTFTVGNYTTGGGVSGGGDGGDGIIIDDPSSSSDVIVDSMDSADIDSGAFGAHKLTLASTTGLTSFSRGQALKMGRIDPADPDNKIDTSYKVETSNIMNVGDPDANGHIELTLQTDQDLRYFQKGDEVQPGVTVISVDVAGKKMVVSGGSWGTITGGGTSPDYADGNTWVEMGSLRDFAPNTPGSTWGKTISAQRAVYPGSNDDNTMTLWMMPGKYAYSTDSGVTWSTQYGTTGTLLDGTKKVSYFSTLHAYNTTTTSGFFLHKTAFYDTSGGDLIAFDDFINTPNRFYRLSITYEDRGNVKTDFRFHGVWQTDDGEVYAIMNDGRLIRNIQRVSDEGLTGDVVDLAVLNDPQITDNNFKKHFQLNLFKCNSRATICDMHTWIAQDGTEILSLVCDNGKNTGRGETEKGIVNLRNKDYLGLDPDNVSMKRVSITEHTDNAPNLSLGSVFTRYGGWFHGPVQGSNGDRLSQFVCKFDEGGRVSAVSGGPNSQFMAKRPYGCTEVNDPNVGTYAADGNRPHHGLVATNDDKVLSGSVPWRHLGDKYTGYCLKSDNPLDKDYLIDQRWHKITLIDQNPNNSPYRGCDGVGKRDNDWSAEMMDWGGNNGSGLAVLPCGNNIMIINRNTEHYALAPNTGRTIKRVSTLRAKSGIGTYDNSSASNPSSITNSNGEWIDSSNRLGYQMVIKKVGFREQVSDIVDETTLENNLRFESRLNVLESSQDSNDLTQMLILRKLYENAIYDSTQTYALNDIVTFEGEVYVSTTDENQSVPTSTINEYDSQWRQLTTLSISTYAKTDYVVTMNNNLFVVDGITTPNMTLTEGVHTFDVTALKELGYSFGLTYTEPDAVLDDPEAPYFPLAYPLTVYRNEGDNEFIDITIPANSSFITKYQTLEMTVRDQEDNYYGSSVITLS